MDRRMDGCRCGMCGGCVSCNSTTNHCISLVGLKEEDQILASAPGKINAREQLQAKKN